MTTHTATFIGSGNSSSAVKLTLTRGQTTLAFAVQFSLVDARIWTPTGTAFKSGGRTKSFEEMLTEVTGARLTASLRQPGFIDHYGSFVIRGPDMALALRASQRTSILHTLNTALLDKRNRHQKQWSMFRGEQNVMVTCLTLGDLGDLHHFILERPRVGLTPNVVRQWTFTLFWSLLVAQRSFGFELRDIKPNNIVVRDAVTSGTMHFRMIADDTRVVRFQVKRNHLDYSRFVPQFIDFGFCSYHTTVLTEDVSLPNLFHKWRATPRWKTALPPHDFNVNPAARPFATVPSPEMLFFLDGSRRDYASDVFALGISTFHLFLHDPTWLHYSCINKVEAMLFTSHVQVAAHTVLPRELANFVIAHMDALLLPYILLLHVLGHPILPVDDDTINTPLYRVLDSIRPYLTAHPALEVVREKVQGIVGMYGPESVDFLRACLTWNKATRGNFPGAPDYRETMPATYRLLFHPYFATLRTEDEAGTEDESYLLTYSDPMHRATASKGQLRRVCQRILEVENAALGELREPMNVKPFETKFWKMATNMMDQREHEQRAAAAKEAERVMDGEPDAKRPRVDIVDPETDGSNAMVMAEDADSSTSTAGPLDKSFMDLDEEEFTRMLEDISKPSEMDPWSARFYTRTRPPLPVRLYAEAEDLSGL